MQSADELKAAQTARDEEIDAGEFSGPLEWYWHFSQRNDFQADSEQLRVLEKLERLFNELEEYRQYRQGPINRLVTNLGAGRKPPRGMYIWGGVGRGKSLMMDAFFRVLPHRRKRRVHFHEFMREIHARLRELSGQPDPLDAISAAMVSSGSGCPESSRMRACTSRMNSWKCTRRFRRWRDTLKKASISSDLPRPTPPQMYMPRGGFLPAPRFVTSRLIFPARYRR